MRNPNGPSIEEKEAMAEELLDKNDQWLATQQIENIAKAIRALEGLPVDFRLARKLSDVLKDITEIYAPK